MNHPCNISFLISSSSGRFPSGNELVAQISDHPHASKDESPVLLQLLPDGNAQPPWCGFVLLGEELYKIVNIKEGWIINTKKRQQRAITRFDEASGGFKFGAGLKVDFILI